MKKILALAPVLALAACVEAQPPEQPAVMPPTCGAEQYQGLVGQSQSVLRDMMLPAGTRVIGPRDPVTMDFRQDRLNFEIGADGRIARVGCF
ncbi:I78 family peptidase inhibitor [Paracoccus sp. (in: a-proteobacteria)]|uniref:I78 family peptidase inhibitor n=1 Tax=Paracoccus sp. TaxID=267 RepID=UPI0032207843